MDRFRTFTLALVLALMAGAAHAQSPEEFYKGKTLSLIIPNAPGGSFDLYARLAANQRRLDIDQHSIVKRILLVGMLIHTRVTDRADRAVVVIRVGLATEAHFAHVNRDAKIHSNLSNCHGQRLEVIGRVGAGIAYHNQTTPAQDHFVQAKILEMPAIRQINVRAL